MIKSSLPRITILLAATVSLSLLSLCSRPANASTTAAKYTANDDVSWAITHSDKLNYAYHQELYNNFIKVCNEKTRGSCQAGENFRLRMNALQPAGVYNYTKVGFQKIKVPTELWNLLHDFYVKNKGKETIEWKSVNPYHNMWEAPPYFISLENPAFGGGPGMQKEIWRLARPILEEWTGQRLTPVSVYGVRIYKNNSILAPHVDRMPLVTSCIINLDQDVDEEWPLEVFDHDGNAHNVTIQPGDMVLYESHSVIHGRPFPMKGREFVNVFLHFEPIGPLDDLDYKPPDGLPPHVIPGGTWEDEFRKTGRWKVPDHVGTAISKGDTRALENMAHHNPEKLLAKDDNGWAPIHEAAYGGHKPEVEFLLEHGATLEERVGADNSGPNVVELAQQSPYLNPNHEVIQYLLELDKSEL